MPTVYHIVLCSCYKQHHLIFLQKKVVRLACVFSAFIWLVPIKCFSFRSILGRYAKLCTSSYFCILKLREQIESYNIKVQKEYQNDKSFKLHNSILFFIGKNIKYHSKWKRVPILRNTYQTLSNKDHFANLSSDIVLYFHIFHSLYFNYSRAVIIFASAIT